MGRDEITKVEPGGFVEYTDKQLPKVDAMRRDKSQPDFFGVPILTDAEVGYSTAAQLGGKPASCYTCKEQNPDLTCERLGPGIKIAKVRGSKDSGERVEYWPCCDEHWYGKHDGPTHYHSQLDTPDDIGLVWINAPKVGQEFGGANCGGVEGGDDCDFYTTRGKTEKWDTEQGICKVLQHAVNAADVCRAWRDDDELKWVDAQNLIRGDSVDATTKKKMVRYIMGRSD